MSYARLPLPIADVRIEVHELGATVAELSPAHLTEFLVGFANTLAKMPATRINLATERAISRQAEITARGAHILTGIRAAINDMGRPA